MTSPATVVSSQVPYASPTDLISRVDKRTVAQLASDTNVPLADAAVLTDPNVAAAILDASGLVEAAALAGGRYTAVDLIALTGASQSLLKMLVCDLAMGRLVLRRPQKERLPAVYVEAQNYLDRLRWGERIFSFQETQDAGTYHLHTLHYDDITRLDLATYQARRVFGLRGDRQRGLEQP